MDVNYGEPTETIPKIIAQYKPVKLWIALGEGGNQFKVETLGRNERKVLVDHFGNHVKDNAGNYPGKYMGRDKAGNPVYFPIFNIPGGKNTIPTDFRTSELAKAIEGLVGPKTKVIESNDAGQFICDETLYYLNYQRSRPTTAPHGVFIHVPAWNHIPGQPNGISPKDNATADIFAKNIVELVEQLTPPVK